MSDKHKRTRRTIGAIGAFFMIKQYLLGKSLEDISEQLGCSYYYATQVVTAYHELQKITPREIAAPVNINPTKFTESELLNIAFMPDEKFYQHTGLDKNNRWWVNKGKMI